MIEYLTAFGLTVAIELPLYYGGLRWMAGVPLGRALLLALAINLATHPVIWFLLFPLLSTWLPLTPALITVETFAMLIEWALLVRLVKASSSGLLILSLAANAISLVLGRFMLG